MNGYLSTEEYSKDKTDGITAFITGHVGKDLVAIVTLGEIEYMVLDFHSLYYELPYFNNFNQHFSAKFTTRREVLKLVQI